MRFMPNKMEQAQLRIPRGDESRIYVGFGTISRRISWIVSVEVVADVLDKFFQAALVL